MEPRPFGFWLGEAACKLVTVTVMAAVSTALISAVIVVLVIARVGPRFSVERVMGTILGERVAWV